MRWIGKLGLGLAGAAGAAAIVLMAVVGVSVGAAEPEGFAGNKVTQLVKADLTGVANRQVIANLYEVPAGAIVPRHFHHGDEFHLVIAGEWMAEVEDRSPRLLKPGDAQYVEREKWHGGKVVGATPLRLLGLMIVEKDKPVLELKR